MRTGAGDGSIARVALVACNTGTGAVDVWAGSGEGERAGVLISDAGIDANSEP